MNRECLSGYARNSGITRVFCGKDVQKGANEKR